MQVVSPWVVSQFWDIRVGQVLVTGVEANKMVAQDMLTAALS